MKTNKTKEMELDIANSNNEIPLSKTIKKNHPKKENHYIQRNVGYLFFNELYNLLKLDKLFNIVSQVNNFNFDLNLFFKEKIFNNILDPNNSSSSKISYYLGKSITLDSIDAERVSNCLKKLHEDIYLHLYKYSTSIINRSSESVYCYISRNSNFNPKDNYTIVLLDSNNVIIYSTLISSLNLEPQSKDSLYSFILRSKKLFEFSSITFIDCLSLIKDLPNIQGLNYSYVESYPVGDFKKNKVARETFNISTFIKPKNIGDKPYKIIQILDDNNKPIHLIITLKPNVNIDELEDLTLAQINLLSTNTLELDTNKIIALYSQIPSVYSTIESSYSNINNKDINSNPDKGTSSIIPFLSSIISSTLLAIFNKTIDITQSNLISALSSLNTQALEADYYYLDTTNQDIIKLLSHFQIQGDYSYITNLELETFIDRLLSCVFSTKTN